MKLPVYFFAVCLLASLAGADVIYRNQTAVEDAMVISSDAQGTVVEFNLLALDESVEQVEGFGSGSVFSIPSGGDMMGLIGSPDLPVIRRMVLVPDMGQVEIEILDSTTEPLGSYTVPPAQDFPTWSGPAPDFRMDQEVYSSSRPFPSQPVVLEAVGILRDIRVAWVVFSPLQISPATGQVEMTTSVTVRVSTNGNPGENEILRQVNGYTRSFLPIYEKVLGFEMDMDAVDGSFVFIGTEESIECAEELMQWKAQKGYEVHTGLLSVIGYGTDDIDSYLEDAYNNWPNPPEYVIIMGDAPIVASPQYNGHAADNQYAVVGSGPIPSMHISRISGNDTDDLTYVSWKIAEAESNPWQPSGESWFNHAFSMACTDPMNAAYESLMLHQLFQANALQSNFYCDALGGLNPTLSAVQDEINGGVSVINYIGHGSLTSWITSGFSVSHMASLTNGRKMPWVFTVGCQNGEFDSGYCFCEGFLSEGTLADPKGAITIMGSSTNTPIGPGDTLQIHTFRGYFTDEIHHLGAAHTNGKIECYNSFGSSGIDMVNMAHVFGCPETDIYTDTSPIAALSNTHSTTITPGTFQVVVTDDTDGAVEGALVGVYCVGTEELLASGYTDGSGVVNLDIASVPGGEEITITSTAHNRVPAMTTANTTSVEESASGQLADFSFGVQGGNPVIGSAAFTFSIPGTARVTLDVFDMTGRRVASVLNGELEAGVHSLTWDGTSFGGPVPSGVYFATVSSRYGSASRSIVLLR